MPAGSEVIRACVMLVRIRRETRRVVHFGGCDGGRAYHEAWLGEAMRGSLQCVGVSQPSSFWLPTAPP